ncbi:hypothetical protein [Halothiobacillus sp.]|uniref:hypothetical protein n=1 Tax=Halothiobacillus sp. TaxID=1891311 RepID=UPI002622AF4C|nr:hypothetical protein [Halothiobacillus sp.]
MWWRQFLQLVVFRIGPEDMPAGWRATRWALLWFLICGLVVVIVNREAAEPVSTELWHGVFDNMLDAAIVAGYAWGWLSFRKRPARLPQLLTALLGALGVLSLVLAALWWFMPIHPGEEPVRGWWIIALFAWDVLVVGQIFRRALELGAVPGALISLGYFILSGTGVVWVHTLVLG